MWVCRSTLGGGGLVGIYISRRCGCSGDGVVAAPTPWMAAEYTAYSQVEPP